MQTWAVCFAYTLAQFTWQCSPFASALPAQRKLLKFPLYQFKHIFVQGKHDDLVKQGDHKHRFDKGQTTNLRHHGDLPCGQVVRNAVHEWLEQESGASLLSITSVARRGE
jgi:hypothetical protein